MMHKNQKVVFVVSSGDGRLLGKRFSAASEEEANKKLCDLVINSSAAAATAESICGTMTASVDRVVRVTVNAKTELSYSRVCEILARAGFVPDCECKIDYEKNSRNEIEVLTLAGKQRYEVSIDDDRS